MWIIIEEAKLRVLLIYLYLTYCSNYRNWSFVFYVHRHSLFKEANGHILKPINPFHTSFCHREQPALSSSCRPPKLEKKMPLAEGD
jgi:hypothetical protein